MTTPSRGSEAAHRQDASEREGPVARHPWVPPTVTELPKLTDLTLATGSPIPGFGNTGGGGSTVF
jgi:hypothetical protein